MLTLEYESTGVYWNIHIWSDITHTFDILVYLRSSVSSHRQLASGLNTEKYGGKQRCQQEIKRKEDMENVLSLDQKKNENTPAPSAAQV